MYVSLSLYCVEVLATMYHLREQLNLLSFPTEHSSIPTAMPNVCLRVSSMRYLTQDIVCFDVHIL